MYCVKCGAKAEKGQKTCRKCGMRLIAPEALLRLLRKADLERKLKNENHANALKDASLSKGYMERLYKDEKALGAPKRKGKTGETVLPLKRCAPEKKVAPQSGPDEKRRKTLFGHEANKEEMRAFGSSDKWEAPSSDKAKKRVTPIFENPTQPKRRSIFDDEPVRPQKKRPESESGEMSKPRKIPKSDSSGKKISPHKTNPAVKLPEKRSSISERRIEEKDARFVTQLFFIPEKDESNGRAASRRKTRSGQRTIEQKKPKRPDRSKAVPEKNRSSLDKGRSSSRTKTAPANRSARNSQKKKNEENFVEKYLRSIVSMLLLSATIVLTLMWGYATDNGNRTMAELGLGTRRGYILLGDDCMANGNYKRAVEHYYKALSKRVNYEAGLKLSKAYRQTGETDKEVSALLMLMDHYAEMDEPYIRILELYPDPNSRPDKVQNAIYMHDR